MKSILVVACAGYAAAAARFCSPNGGCKYGPVRTDIQPDTEFVWTADGTQVGYVGRAGCNATNYAVQLPAGKSVKGKNFDWTCLYIASN